MAQTASEKKLIKLGVNKEYARRAPELQEIQDLVDGNHSVLKSEHFLWTHEFEQNEKEGANIRKRREQRSRYTNCMEIVVSTWTSLILKNDPAIPASVNAVFGDEGLKDVDGEGNNLKTFMREKVAPIYFALGNAHILTNAPNIEVANRKVEKGLGIRPFWTVLSPLVIKDWMFTNEVASLRQYREFRYEFLRDGERQSLEEQHEEFIHSNRLAIIDNKVCEVRYKSSKPYKEGSLPPKDWEKIEELTIDGLAELPIAHVTSDTWLRSVKEQQLRLFNFESALDNQLISQAFQRIFISGMTSEKAKMLLNEFVINFLPEGANVTIAEPSNPVALERRIMTTIVMLFKVAFNHQFIIAEGSKESPSAESTKAMKQEMIALALNAIDDLELLLNRAVKHYAMFKKHKGDIEDIKLSREITEADIEMTITLATSVFQQMMESKTWIRSYLKAVARRMPLDDLEAIEKEIDSLEFGPKKPDIMSALKSRLNPGKIEDDQRDPEEVPTAA